MEFLFKFKNRRVLLFFIDFFTVFVSSFFAGTLLATSFMSWLEISSILRISLIFSLVCLPVLVLLRVYRILWRYAQIKDFISCLLGVVITTILLDVIAHAFGFHELDVCLFMSGIISGIGVCATRAFYALIYYRFNKSISGNTTKRVMIIGAGEGGRIVCDMMKSEHQKYNPVVFVDDDPSKIGRYIDGVVVKGKTSSIPRIAKNLGIDEIIFAISSISPENKKRILNICSETLCKVNIIQGLDNYIHGGKSTLKIKGVNVEDLLGRNVVKLDDKQTYEMICDKVCMITGGGGSIGSELARQVAAMKPRKLIIVDIYENNAYDIQQELVMEYGKELDLSIQIASVRDYDKLECVFCEFMPQIIFHAAAHKHVPLMETNPEEAIKNNIFGTLNTAKLAEKYGAEKFVLVSTDKAVNPTNIMGATKRCCEMIIECMAQQKTKTEFVAVRFGNVLGSNGSVIPLFERQIANGGPVTVTDSEIIRYFMTIPEAAALILQAATMARGGEIFVLDMGEPVKILNLAENLIKLHGFKPYVDIDIKFTGLRPGEKLYEELLMSEEGLKNTANNKIFIGKQMKVSEEEFYASLEKLYDAANNNDKVLVEELLKEIVPTFLRKEDLLKRN